MALPSRTPFLSRLTGGAAAAVLLGGAALAQSANPVEQGPPNVPDFAPAFPEQTRAPASDSGVTLAIDALSRELENPWAVAVLPDGAILITERPGRLRVFRDGVLGEPVAGVPEVLAEEQGGMLDVAPSPNFAQDRTIFLTYSKPLPGGSATAAARAVLSEDMTRLTGVTDIFVQEPPSPSPMHYGSRLAFDGEGHVFISTGEHFTETERVLAQDPGATYGKIVRLSLDGSVPQDNPFVGEEGAIPSIWSLGHRNVQSLAVDASGQLWSGEHGPQGGDEINRIEPGANYGWPVISYGQNYDGSPVGEGVTEAAGLEQPVYYWDPVIAPGGMTFYDGALFADWQGDLLIASLSGALVRLELEGDRVMGEERLLTEEGRIRDVAVQADGSILVVTDDPAEGALLRLAPED